MESGKSASGKSASGESRNENLAVRSSPINVLGKWLPALLWAAVLFTLSAIPGQQIPSVQFISFSDKLAHCLVYGILGALSFRAVRMTTRLGRWQAILLVTMLAAGYGISDEVHQMFVPERSPDAMDVLADVVGGALGAGVAGWLPFFRGRA